MDSSKTPTPQESKLHFLDYWRIIRIRKTVILAVFLLVVITATVVTYIIPPTYSSTARIKVERDNPDIGFVDMQANRQGYDPYFIQTEFEVLQSEAILGKVIQNLNLEKTWGDKYQGGTLLKPHECLELLKKSMNLTPVRNASIIEIEVFSDTPQEAAAIANEIAKTYKEHRVAVNMELMSTGIKALEERKKEHDQVVEAQQKKVDQLRIDLKINEAAPMDKAPAPTLSAEALRQMQSQLYLARIQLVSQETRLNQLKVMSRDKVREAVQTALDVPDAQLTTLFNEYDIAQQQLLAAELDYTKEHPTYQNREKNVKELNDKINARIDGILTGLQTRLDSTKAGVEEIALQLESAKTNDLAVTEQSRPYYAAKEKLFELQQFNMVLGMKIAAQQTELTLPRNAMVTLLDKAFEDPEPVRPRKGLNIALGVVIGLVVGIGLAFFIEYLDTSVKTIDDVERTLQAPVLGVIPQNVGYLLEEGAESPHAEAYRVLRTNLLFSRKDDKLNSIAVVSAGAGEGKSTTVVNLATVFAQNGSRVVVVDSDLRRPTLHKVLGVTNNIGLTNYLLRQNTLEEVIQTTNLPTLDFMASGKLPSSSMGVLSSAQMKNLIHELKQRYDYVFFDSPPIMGVSDASILASELDLTLQVIQYRRYPQPMNIRAKQMIEKVGGNLLGIVLNNINMSQDESYYYYSGYYHDYYYSKTETEDTEAKAEGDKDKVEIKPKY